MSFRVGGGSLCQMLHPKVPVPWHRSSGWRRVCSSLLPSAFYRKIKANEVQNNPGVWGQRITPPAPEGRCPAAPAPPGKRGLDFLFNPCFKFFFRTEVKPVHAVGGAHCHHRSPPHHPSVCLSTPAQSSLLGCRETPQGGVSTPTDQPEWGTTPECPPTGPSWLWVPPPAANIPIFCFSRGSLGFCGDTWRGHTRTPPVLPPPGSLSLGAALVTRTRRSLLLLFRAIKR